jgi:hypothetical protein
VERCYFAKDAPDVELRGDLIFIVPREGHCEIALTPATLRRFVLCATEALAKWQVDSLDRVVPFRGGH